VSETHRDEQKLWLILFQIKGVRSRLNFLALQRWLFIALAILIGGLGLTLFAAARFGPLTFLGVTILLLIAAIIGIIRETILLLAMRKSPQQVAAIADARSQMKGRLATVLALAANPKRSALWAYLVEDTYGHREEFEPARVAPQWLSRALYPLLASILLAGLALPAAHFRRASQRSPVLSSANVPDQITADIGNLDIRPADPALQPNAEIYGDQETLRKLADKLAAAQDADHNKHGLSKLVDRARTFADAFQHKLNGLDQAPSNPTPIRLTDRNHSPSNKPAHNDTKPGKGGAGCGLVNNSTPSAAGPSQSRAAQPPPTTSPPPQSAGELAAKDLSMQAASGSEPAPGTAQSAGDAGDANTGSGSNHGSGSDPSGLYGPASAQPLGSDSFKIAIDAEPSDESSTSGSPTYVLPKVRVPLNSNQFPDQPLARTAVPTADQNTIKRVFER
jgi:hypothetical protein